MQVFENKVLRKIFGPKRDDETGEWRRLHNGEFFLLAESSCIPLNYDEFVILKRTI